MHVTFGSCAQCREAESHSASSAGAVQCPLPRISPPNSMVPQTTCHVLKFDWFSLNAHTKCWKKMVENSFWFLVGFNRLEWKMLSLCEVNVPHPGAKFICREQPVSIEIQPKGEKIRNLKRTPVWPVYSYSYIFVAISNPPINSVTFDIFYPNWSKMFCIKLLDQKQ